LADARSGSLWHICHVRLALVIVLAGVNMACSSGPRATLTALSYRAVFDLGCPAQALQLHHLDDRSKAVAGCGRRLIYVEDCQRHGMSQSCTWMLDTPTLAQQAWPHAQPAAQPHPAALAVPVAARPTPQPSRELGHGAAAMPVRGRPIRTDLDSPSQGVIVVPHRSGAASRPVQTDLFDPDDKRDVLEHRR
jgi:hypothetical protein